MSKLRASRVSLEFARANNLERFRDSDKVSPTEFTPEELQQFQIFKQENGKARQSEYNQRSYEKKRLNTVLQGSPPPLK